MSKRKDFRKIDKRVNWLVKSMNKQVYKDFDGRYDFHQIAKTRKKLCDNDYLRIFKFELRDEKCPERNKYVKIQAHPHLGYNPLLIETLFEAYNNFVCDGEGYASAN